MDAAQPSLTEDVQPALQTKAWPFPSPTCNVEGCPRRGENMVHSGHRVMFVKGSDQRGKVVVYRFTCRTNTEPYRYFHNAYVGPHGESLERIASGHFRFTDATTEQLIEIVAGSKSDRRPFPNPKCEVERCLRRGENLWHTDQRAMALKGGGGEQTVTIHQFGCRLQKPYRHLHVTYVGPHGEPVTHSAKGHFSFTDSTSGVLVETESSHARAMSDPVHRGKLSAAGKRAWKKPSETRLQAIRISNANPTRRAKISAAGKRRWANPEERQKYSARQRAYWASLTPAQRQRITRRQMRGCRTPEAMQRKSESLRRSWARKKTEMAEALSALKIVKSGVASLLPADWKEKPETWWFVGLMLLQEDQILNRDLGLRLDKQGLVRCPYGERTAAGKRESTTWVAFFAERRGWVWVNEVRNWVNKPGLEK